jgi:hypothetical protein
MRACLQYREQCVLLNRNQHQKPPANDIIERQIQGAITQEWSGR